MSPEDLGGATSNGMDKIYLKPTPKEITMRGSLKEGRTDVFAYDYHDDDNRRKLGGLYIIGNVKQEDDSAIEADSEKDGQTDTDSSSKNPAPFGKDSSPDIAYVTNLVASLAKREYYSRSDASPREAFSATLKKINDVVEEFFKNKTLKVNIGIFAVAGEQILISKLGKFKIILGRDSRAIDILNNIDLFSKDPVEEKEFSGIVSGKVMPGDKLFAFYPNRMVSAREKTLKADLLKFDGEQFLGRLGSIKEEKPDFDCGGLHLTLNTHKEPAADKKPKFTIPDKDNSPAVNLAKTSLKKPEASTAPIQHPLPGKVESPVEPPEEIPRIIPAEFSLGKKVNPLLVSILAPIKTIKDLRGRNINLKKKFVILSLVTGVLAIGVILIKTFIVIDPAQRQLNTAISQTRNNLKLARTKISQNDVAGARQLLAESLSSINSMEAAGDKTQKITVEIHEVLDSVDKATDISPSLLEAMPEDLKQKIAIFSAYKDRGIAFDIYENNLYILASDNILKVADVDSANKKEPSSWLKSGELPPQPVAIAVDGGVYVINASGVLTVYYKGEKVSEFNTLVASNIGDVLLTTKDSDKLYLANKTLARIYELDKKSGSLIRTIKIGSSEPFTDAYLTSDGAIIIVAKDGRIWAVK